MNSRMLRLLALATLCVAPWGGCYERTVSASGFGTDRVQIQRTPEDNRVLGYPKNSYKNLPTTH